MVIVFENYDIDTKVSVKLKDGRSGEAIVSVKEYGVHIENFFNEGVLVKQTKTCEEKKKYLRALYHTKRDFFCGISDIYESDAHLISEIGEPQPLTDYDVKHDILRHDWLDRADEPAIFLETLD